MTLSLENVHKIVDDAILNLVLQFSTYAQFLVRIGYTYKDFGNAIACTDGKTIYINDKLIAEINTDPIKTNTISGKQVDCTIGKQEMMFVLCHELMHLLTATLDRADNLGIPRKVVAGDIINETKIKMWNIATDYAINSLLVNNMEGCCTRKPIGKIPQSALYEEKYRDMTAEEIYKRLEKNSNISIIELGSSGLPYELDKHMDINDELVKSELANKISEVFGSTDNGTSDLSIDRFVKDMMKPLPFDWKNALTKYIRGWIKENYTWNKPSRAGIANGLILPSYGKSPRIHMAIAVDTSGSISNEELQTMFNHVTTILSVFNNFEIDLWCCGSRVYQESFVTYTKQSRHKIKDFKVMSDGGNDMRTNFEFLKTHYKGDKPDIFICLTDGYDPINRDEETTSPCPVIWLIVDNPQFIPPSKMKCVVYPYIVDKNKNGG